MTTKPSAPWDPPPTAPRTPCAGCQDTGRITTLAGIASCDLCADQRAIDSATASRKQMDQGHIARAHAKFQEGKTLSEQDAIVAGKAWREAWSEAGGALPNPGVGVERQPEVMSTVANIPNAATTQGPRTFTVQTARILEMSAAKYHTDPIDPDVPSLSNSIASTIVIDCAYMAWLAHPRLGNCPTPPTKGMELGTLRHAASLEAGRGIAPLPFDDWRTKASKEARDDARANGLLPMLAREYEPLMAIGQDVRDTLADIGMSLRGKSEVVVTWHEQSKFGPVLCRAMMDHLIVDEQSAEIIDLKFISSADLKTCIQHTYQLGYDMQASFYTSAIEKLYPHLAGRVRFRFAFCQVMPAGSPRRVLITPVELNGEFKVLGRERSQRAIEIWAKCLKTDQWPGYVPDGHIERIAPAPWMLTGEMDQQRAMPRDEDEESDETTE